MKEKKKKIIILSIAIVAVIAIIAGSTYAYWQITKTQKDTNDMVAACLDITMQNESGTFGLDKAWPISESEGEALTGYTFEVKNNCDENVNYIVGLNSVAGDSDNYLDYSSLRLKLDDKQSALISDFGDIGYSDPENKEVVRDSKLLSMESLEGKGTATHNVKVWIDKDAPVEEQGKLFSGQIFITGGQGLPVQNECFAIDTEGTILSYDYSCGYNVSVPATIAGIEVKTIIQASFAMSNIQAYSIYNEETDDGKGIFYITDENIADDIIVLFKQDMCDDPTTCTLEDMEAMGLKIITTEEEYNAIDWEGYAASGYTIEGPYAMMFNPDTGEMDEGTSQVTSLDLSEAVFLENIDDESFEDNEVLEMVLLPSDGMLKTIGDYAFGETNIKEITIPSSVVTIGESAFYSKNEVGYLEKVVFEDTPENPSQLKTIGERAFEYNQLTKVVIPSTVEIIGNVAFSRNQITEAVVGAKTIGDGSFRNNKLTSVTIKDSVETIEREAFFGNEIQKLTFEDTLENPSQLIAIGEYAFRNYNQSNTISEVIIPRSLVTISDLSFYEAGIESIVIPNTVNVIGTSAFYGNKLKEVTLPKSVKTIANNAFAYNQISSLDIPDNITYLNGFEHNQISKLTIPSSVETIGELAFQNNRITDLVFEGKLEAIETLAFANNLLTNATVPAKIIGRQAFSANKLTTVNIKSNVEIIGVGAFSGSDYANQITSLTFEDTEENPSRLTQILGEGLMGAFWGNNLTKVIIPASVTTIGSSAFGSNPLTDVIIKNTEGNVTIGPGAIPNTATVTYDPNYTE